MSRLSFPTNPRRPEIVGRGERNPQVTEGLVNHQKADKARATRQRNAAAKAAGPTPATIPSTPSTPTAQTTIVPPPSSAVPSRLRMQQPAQLSSMTPGPLRPPLAAITPQEQSAPSAFHHLPSPSPITHRQEAVPVPHNYQPRYPDYRSLPGSSLSTSIPSSSPMDDAHFGRMLANMTPAQLTLMTQGFAPSLDGALYQFDDGSNGDNMGGSIGRDSEDGGSTGALGGNSDPSSPALVLPDDDDDDEAGDREYREASWNMEQPNGGEDDEQDLHENARSSLEVTMHTVDVRKKTRKRKALTQYFYPKDPEDTESDSGSHRPTRNKTSRKKKRNRKQKSRSIHDVDIDRQRIVRTAYDPIQKAVTTEIPWPMASPSGDPSADDDDIQYLLDNSWMDACDRLGLDPEDVGERTPEESNLIHSRISQVRGNIIAIADKIVPAAYGFIQLDSLADPTPGNISTAMEANRQLVDDLQGTFMNEDPKKTAEVAAICRHPIFQQLLNRGFFAKQGVNRRAHYFVDADTLPVETMAFLFDAVICAINRWKTGEYDVKQAPFSTEAYAVVHQASLEFIKAWIAEYSLPNYPENLATALLRDMLTKQEKAQPKRAMYPMHLFTSTAGSN
ncbi:hypothetical protein B0H13DRAFT_2341562 [Mycena leptocephala]|nr:hypothetical protein B0H13DRAFT_2341562 [Mycena leptocephala]